MRHTMLVVSVAVAVMVKSYGMVLLAVLYAYRKGYGIVGKPELALRFMAKGLAGLSQNRF